MGRRRKLYTDQLRKEADIKKARKYYERNAEKIKERNLQRYYKSETGSLGSDPDFELDEILYPE